MVKIVIGEGHVRKEFQIGGELALVRTLTITKANVPIWKPPAKNIPIHLRTNGCSLVCCCSIKNLTRAVYASCGEMINKYGVLKTSLSGHIKSTLTYKQTHRAYTHTHTAQHSHICTPASVANWFRMQTLPKLVSLTTTTTTTSTIKLDNNEREWESRRQRERERGPRDNESPQSCADNAKRAVVSRGEPRSGADARNLVCENQSFLLVVASNESVSIKPREPALKCLRVCLCVWADNKNNAAYRQISLTFDCVRVCLCRSFCTFRAKIHWNY